MLLEKKVSKRFYFFHKTNNCIKTMNGHTNWVTGIQVLSKWGIEAEDSLLVNEINN